MAVPLLDISRQYEYLRADLDKAVLEVIQSGQFILGPPVARLEEEVAGLCGVKYAIGVASGTDALLVALHAVGVKPGDEVITTNFSFFSTAGVINRLGARPVFVDIEPESYNMDPSLIEAAITDKTKAIMPVHLFGQVADMDSIMEIASRHNLKVIEDAAQAIGAEYKNRPAGSIGDCGCFSFYPTKNLGAAGDAGMIVTNSDELHERCRRLRVHGQSGKYIHSEVGYNSRLDSVQAAVLSVKLPHLRKWSEARAANAARYSEAFSSVANIKPPRVMDYTTFHIYNQYTLASPKREHILAGLQESQIGHCIYYPLAFSQQPCFSYLGYAENEFPVSVKASQEVFSIPVFPELKPDEIEQVIVAITRLAGD